MTIDDAGLEGPFQSRIADALAAQEKIFRNTFPGAIGARIIEAREGYARAEITVDHRIVNPGMVAHGGALSGFGDTVAAWASFPGLAEDEMFTTIEFKATFTAPAFPGQRLTGEATVVHRGKRTMVLDVRITNDEGSLVCVMLVTQAIISTGGAQQRSGRY
jgi:uncharacterized protein (TIGR00369 family)